ADSHNPQFTDIINQKGTEGQITMTQTPTTVSVSPGQDISLRCSTSQDISLKIVWYQLQAGYSPKLLIKTGDERFDELP
uniref:Immunoglobulin V-set domain-containing protein n=1 Tax=Lepisosteus oculatus TaxID=7918 RepID=W5LWY0_LEPOC